MVDVDQRFGLHNMADCDSRMCMCEQLRGFETFQQLHCSRVLPAQHTSGKQFTARVTKIALGIQLLHTQQQSIEVPSHTLPAIYAGREQLTLAASAARTAAEPPDKSNPPHLDSAASESLSSSPLSRFHDVSKYCLRPSFTVKGR